MPLQDLIFSAGVIILTVTLLPTVLGDDKPALSTAAAAAVVLFLFSATFASLGLWLSASLQFLQALLWALIAIQVLRRRSSQTGR